MSGPSRRGIPPVRSAQPSGRTPPVSPARGRAATVGKGARTRIRKPRIAVDRIVVMRIALAAIVLAFLYLIVSIGILAFGGGAARHAKKIDRVVTDSTNLAPGAPASTVRPDAAKAAASP